MDKYKTYLFEYRFDGYVWGFDMKAKSPEEATARVKAAGLGQYKGELIATINVPDFLTFWQRLKRMLFSSVGYSK